MRILAILLNLILLGEVIFLFVTDGVPSGYYLLIIATMILAPIFSIIAIIFAKGNNWLSLYFKRKALEEKLKIDQLSGNKN